LSLDNFRLSSRDLLIGALFALLQLGELDLQLFVQQLLAVCSPVLRA
jgi:hypothetical protein